jgi:hypothetical protein
MSRSAYLSTMTWFVHRSLIRGSMICRSKTHELKIRKSLKRMSELVKKQAGTVTQTHVGCYCHGT